MPQWKRRVAEHDWIRIERINGKSKVGESQIKSGKAVEVVYEHVVPSEEYCVGRWEWKYKKGR